MSQAADASASSRCDDPDAIVVVADPGGWVQLDVDLGEVDDMRRRADEVLSALGQRLRECPRVDAFWYLRKPPGLRVRIAGRVDPPRELAAVLERERSAGRILGWIRGVYEPECHRFGGAAGLALAHEFLSASAATYLELTAQRCAATPIDPTIAAIAVYDALVRRMTADMPERWDVWCRLAQLYFGLEPAPGSAARREAPLDWSRVASLASSRERDALERAFAASARVADAFADVARRGETAIGPRAFAVTLATFHWNVWAVERPQLRRAFELMLADLDPVPQAEDP